MADTKQEPTRRDFIYIATGATAAVGGVLAAWPLISSMAPSAAVRALATVEIDLAPIVEGQTARFMWQGKPIFVRHRTAAEIEASRAVPLGDLKDPLARNANLPDDAPATDADRAARPEWLVTVAICTHLGCVPLADQGDYQGFFCPCHGSHYDNAGRVRRGPAPENLPIPPYEFLSDTRIRIG